MTYWTLFAVFLLPSGEIDFSEDYIALASFETRLQCEILRAQVLNVAPAPPGNDLRCLKTDET